MADQPDSGAQRALDAARLRDLERRIAELTPKDEGPSPLAGHDKAHIAWRMVIELVSGLGIGFGIGYGLDYWLGTTPIMLIVFIFLGFAAGVKTMMLTAGELNRPEPPGADQRAGRETGKDEGN
ncbi:MAG: AtpZ/AtpI family protein [Paracoccus sp. (in: a-proteobacteria)]|uniref:AtpZ/AtpI family protein n=1 Tax=Paracoccus sp. TaxID=267 RepID=UPI0026E0D103|nr:AtpZ/AtpI family protein [Paracoccus sp. (in: a-proteobacteria)]MDO5614287.1 AtpZ/AtpI family protein [Paracoccus sp. (in: a-proteobacteria)]MDO5630465.1 AtpZ/AtpI family protein [Paracoccus sp. (in: a-proteobacteria)]